MSIRDVNRFPFSYKIRKKGFYLDRDVQGLEVLLDDLLEDAAAELGVGQQVVGEEGWKERNV